MKQKKITLDMWLIKYRIKAMLHFIMRKRSPIPKVDEPFEFEFSEKDLLAVILFACPWLKEQIDECLNEIEFDISSQIKDVEQQITGKKEDA